MISKMISIRMTEKNETDQNNDGTTDQNRDNTNKNDTKTQNNR